MLNRPLIFSSIALVATLSFADTTDLSLVSSSVSSHPNVVKKANEVILKGINVDQIIAENGLKINLSTRSKLPLLYAIDDADNLNRTSSLDTMYFDGVVTLEKNKKC